MKSSSADTVVTGVVNASVSEAVGLLLLAALQLRLVGGGSPSETLGTMPDEGQQQEQTQAQNRQNQQQAWNQNWNQNQNQNRNLNLKQD